MTTLIALILVAAPSLRAVVYPDRAQVTRAGTANCAKGSALIAFEGLTPAADAQSFRAVSPDGAVLGVRTELKAHQDEFAPQAKALIEEIRKLQDKARDLADAVNRAQQRARVAGNYSDIA